MAVELVTITDADADQRLDRWFKRRFPGLTQGRLQKLLRTGQVRVDGKRVKEAGHRLQTGQEVRVPPLEDAATAPRPKKQNTATVSNEDLRVIEARILHKDDHVLVINKPAGLAVQGGSGTVKHIDAMLDGLKFGFTERPRLVHRLDKDTSGVLVLARTRRAATELGRAFQTKDVRKLYWAATVGVPSPAEGDVKWPLSKRPASGGEKVWVDEFEGKKAHTHYRVLDQAGKRAAWVEMEPLTGRTHQLRVHMLTMGTPILGDGKYGGAEAFITGAEIPKQMHLHARAIRFPSPGGGNLTLVAPLPEHMAQTWAYLGFDDTMAVPPFETED